MHRVFALLTALCGALLNGCSESIEDQILAQYKRGEEAIAAMNPAEMRAVVSTESVARTQELLRLALDASVVETRSLPPTSLSMVIALRNRLEPGELRTMSVDEFLTWQIDEEMIIVDSDYGFVPHSVIVQGDKAHIQMGAELEEEVSRTPRLRTGRRGRGAVGGILSLAGAAASSKKSIEPIEGYTCAFVSSGGFWYVDEVTNALDYDAYLHEEAQAAGVPIDRFLSEREKEEFGSLKPTVWLPVGR